MFSNELVEKYINLDIKTKKSCSLLENLVKHILFLFLNNLFRVVGVHGKRNLAF